MRSWLGPGLAAALLLGACADPGRVEANRLCHVMASAKATGVRAYLERVVSDLEKTPPGSPVVKRSQRAFVLWVKLGLESADLEARLAGAAGGDRASLQAEIADLARRRAALADTVDGLLRGVDVASCSGVSLR